MRCARAVRKVRCFPPPAATGPRVLHSACHAPHCWYTRDVFLSLMPATGAGPPDLTVPGFGVPVGSAYLSARRTFGRPIGRPKVRPYLRPADSAGRRYGRTFGRPSRPAESTAVPSAGRSASRKYGRTFGRPIGRPKVRFNPSPPLVLLPPNTNTPPLLLLTRLRPPPPLLAYYKFPHPPFPSTPPPRPQSLHAKVFFVSLKDTHKAEHTKGGL